LSKEKKSRGRPRIYKDDAEKQKAFREKKKEQYQQLEKRIKELEATLDKDSDEEIDEELPWFDWTFQDLQQMSINQLQEYKRDIMGKLDRYSLHSPIKVIVDKLLGKLDKLEYNSTILIRKEVLRSAREFNESLFNSTILELINHQLMSRTSEIDIDYEIQVAEQRISELEAEIKEKKKHKVSVAKKSE
jgi:hypothetical protein